MLFLNIFKYIDSLQLTLFKLPQQCTNFDHHFSYVNAVFGTKDTFTSFAEEQHALNENKNDDQNDNDNDNDTDDDDDDDDMINYSERVKHTTPREKKCKFDLTLATATNEYGMVQLVRPTDGPGESHENIVPLLAYILENLLKHNLNGVKTHHLFKSDDLQKNRNVPKKVIDYLLRKYPNGIIWHVDGIHYYDLNEWYRTGQLTVCYIQNYIKFFKINIKLIKKVKNI